MAGAGRILLILIPPGIVSWIARKSLDRFRKRLARRGESGGEAVTRAGPLSHLLRQLVPGVLLLIGALVILKEVGVAIAPILAGAGILGLAVGFGAQNLVRDVIAGFFMIPKNPVGVGGVAIPNGTITTLANMTRDGSAHVFEIGMADQAGHSPTGG